MNQPKLPLWMKRLEEQLKLPNEKEEKKKTVDNTLNQNGFKL